MRNSSLKSITARLMPDVLHQAALLPLSLQVSVPVICQVSIYFRGIDAQKYCRLLFFLSPVATDDGFIPLQSAYEVKSFLFTAKERKMNANDRFGRQGFCKPLENQTSDLSLICTWDAFEEEAPDRSLSWSLCRRTARETQHSSCLR